MPSTFQIERKLHGGIVSASVYVVAKDPADDTLARTFGDVFVRRSGVFTDPNDASYTPFRVDIGPNIGVLLNLLPEYKIKCIFDDLSIPIEVRMRQAAVWTAAIIAQITTGLSALRLKTDTTGGNQAVII